MRAPQRNKGISREVKRLLENGEGSSVDFKRTPDSITQEDLVSFANSRARSFILVGITEHRGRAGIQNAEITGCDVGDDIILQIINKATSCIPPIAVSIDIQNSENIPILIVRIDRSEMVPHCTAKGLYCIRDGSRNRPLHPAELLKIFLECEANTFSERFVSAAGEVLSTIKGLEKSIKDSIEDIGDQLGWSEFKLDDTEDDIRLIRGAVEELRNKATDNADRMAAIFQQDNRTDPVSVRKQNEFANAIFDELQKDPKLIDRFLEGKTTISAKFIHANEISDDDFEEIKRLVHKKAIDFKESKSE